MIYDQLDNAALYTGLGERFAQGFAYLQNLAPDAPEGKHEIDGTDLFAAVQSYETAPPEAKKWEGHRLYADIQYVLAGEEIIYHRDIARLTVKTEYNPAKEYTIYEGPEDQALIMRPGNFAIFWPHDGHKPGCQLTTPTPVRKVVVKVRLT